jgi:hypothetical protein
MVTVNSIVLASLSQLGHVNQQGIVEENRERKYLNLAPALCNVLQLELLTCESYDFVANGIPAPLTALTDELTITDMTAQSVLPLGLAREFARIDGDTQYNIFAVSYENAKNMMSFDAPEIVDVYGALTDYDLQG